MVEELYEEQEEKKGFFDWLRSVFKRSEEEKVEEPPKYKRKLLDGRIEKYLDQNMDAYIQEYGIVTGLDIESYEIRYSNLTSRIYTMKEYMIDADAQVSMMEQELAQVEKASKKK
jgi:hypothetical protein